MRQAKPMIPVELKAQTSYTQPSMPQPLPLPPPERIDDDWSPQLLRMTLFSFCVPFVTRRDRESNNETLGAGQKSALSLCNSPVSVKLLPSISTFKLSRSLPAWLRRTCKQEATVVPSDFVGPLERRAVKNQAELNTFCLIKGKMVAKIAWVISKLILRVSILTYCRQIKCRSVQR